MKYIIEIKPEYEGTTKGIIVLGIKNNCLCVDGLAVEELEELNAEYINNHFADISKKVEEAYQKGYDEAKRIYQKPHAESYYQKGLDAAWDAARKIADMWTKIDNDEILAIFGITERFEHSTIRSLFEKQTANEAMLELEAYEEKQEATDEIKVGDEVQNCYDPNVCFVVVSIDILNDKISGFDRKGGTYSWRNKDGWRKTGRHFDIAGLMEEMKR